MIDNHHILLHEGDLHRNIKKQRILLIFEKVYTQPFYSFARVSFDYVFRK